jgi:hypothetical protein
MRGRSLVVSLIGLGGGLASLGACGGSDEPVPAADARAVDAEESPPDARFVPVQACATDDVAMASGDDTNLHTRFYGGAFYLRAGERLYRLRGDAPPSELVATGQSYPVGGAGTTVQLRGTDVLQVLLPAGYGKCQPFEPLALQTVSVGPNGHRDVVARVADLTGELAHVIGEGDAYGDSVVTDVLLLAQGICGDLALQLTLADGRTLVVRRTEGTGAMETLLAVASSGGIGGGDAIDGAAGRHYGYVRRVVLEAEHTLIDTSVDSAAPSRLGAMVTRIDRATGAVTCEVTDTDVPCALTVAAGVEWDLAGDTVATFQGQIVRGGLVQPGSGSNGRVAVCPTGDVFSLRGARGFPEIVAVRRDGGSERVTRFGELSLSGHPTATYVQSFFVGPGCELIVGGGDPGNNSFGYWIHWPDGTLATLAPGYVVAGFDANGDIGIRTLEGAHAIARRPVGCVVPPLP